MKTYAATYCLAVLVGLIATPLVILFARRLKAMDAPGVRRIHSSPVPRMGGLAIVIAALAGMLPSLFLSNAIGAAFQAVRGEFLTILVAAISMFAVGLIDDLKGLSARWKLLAQVTAATMVCASGVDIQAVRIPDLLNIQLGWWSWPVTVLWIVGVTNAVNLIDGLDGLAAGIVAITCAVIAVFALHSGLHVMAILALSMLGSLTAFLAFNFNPARIFMGDGGSMFLGFLLASASVMCAAKAQTAVGLALPALAMGVPIFDTLFVMLRRLLERQGMMSPDRRHIHHRLAAMGLSHRHVAIILYLVTALAAGLGLFMMVTRNVGTLAVFLAVLLLLVVVFRCAGAVRLRETVAGIRKNIELTRHTRRQAQSYDQAILPLCEANGFTQWWQALGRAAEALNLVRVSLAVHKRDGGAETLLWRRPGPDPGPHQVVMLRIPCRDRRAGPPLMMEVDLPINGSLELAGRQAATIARLLEEHGIDNLPPNQPDDNAAPGHGPRQQTPPVPMPTPGHPGSA
jgi:UDP-GlcNAc:undecaprenyl-phosphate GlcNAc-1-phosphate transferase